MEDTLLNQKLTSIILQNNNFEIAIASNGIKAIEILNEQSFDLILMDIQMPEMDGYEATCIIRDELKIKTPIIAMTAHALAGEQEKCFQQGINDYLPKPFTEPDLLFKISNWIKNDEPTNGNQINSVPPQIVDISFLTKQTRNNKSAIKEMISHFCEDNPKAIAKIERALHELDYETIYKTVHSLKTEISMFGLRPLIGNQLTAIEQYAREHSNIEDIRKSFCEVQGFCSQAVRELTTLQIK